MKRVVFVTNHYLNSDRKAGFHWLAEAFWRAGWHVLFFTESISWLSYVRGNERCKYPLFRERHRIHYVRERMASYVWLTPFHPINLRLSWLNRLAAPVLNLYSSFSLGEAEAEIARADLFVFDSDHGLLLFDRFKELNSHARFVYRVSDDIRILGHHPLLPEQEDRVVERFDLVSAPSTRFQGRFPSTAQFSVHNHGLEKVLFDRDFATPYATPRPNVVYVGRNHFDADLLARAAQLFPAWTFHVLGAVGPIPAAPNVIAYGERPFAEIVPYVKHADIGLQNLLYTPGAECFADSLKMFQYTYCRLPIVAPSFLKSERKHVHYYEPGDDISIRAAFLAAYAHDRSTISTAGILTWDELASKLAA